MQYGLTKDNVDYIVKKAKEKKDGVYTIRGVAYRVRDGKVTHFASYGKIMLWLGGFVSPAGCYDWHHSGNCDKEALKNI